MKVVSSALFDVRFSDTPTGVEANIWYNTGNLTVPLKKLITLSANTKSELDNRIEQFMTGGEFMKLPDFVADVLKDAPHISKILENNGCMPPISIPATQLTVLTTFPGQLPAHIETFLDLDNGGMNIACMGCETCPGAPCKPCDVLISSLLDRYGSGNYNIHVQQVKTPVEMAQLQATLPSPLLVLDNELHDVNYPPGMFALSQFNLKDTTLHDIEFDTIDDTGTPVKQMFNNCMTITDGAGDEILHLRTNKDENSLEYLLTPHPDSNKSAVDLSIFIKSMSQKYNYQITVVDYRVKLKSMLRR